MEYGNRKKNAQQPDKSAESEVEPFIGLVDIHQLVKEIFFRNLHELKLLMCSSFREENYGVNIEIPEKSERPITIYPNSLEEAESLKTDSWRYKHICGLVGMSLNEAIDNALCGRGIERSVDRKLKFSVRVKDDALLISIADDGPGISEEMINKKLDNWSSSKDHNNLHTKFGDQQMEEKKLVLTTHGRGFVSISDKLRQFGGALNVKTRLMNDSTLTEYCITLSEGARVQSRIIPESEPLYQSGTGTELTFYIPLGKVD